MLVMRLREKVIDRCTDSYHWLAHEVLWPSGATTNNVIFPANTIIDEFEKFASFKEQASAKVHSLEAELRDLNRTVPTGQVKTVSMILWRPMISCGVRTVKLILPARCVM